MTSKSPETMEDVIETITDDFDRVGFTKTDEADMARQNKKQQFHVRNAFTAPSKLCSY